MEFKTLIPPHTPNNFFSTASTIKSSQAHSISPNYNFTTSELLKELSRIALSEPRTIIISNNINTQQIKFCQRSFAFRFPDYIWAEATKIDSNTSSISIYSKSKYGYSDFGVNKKRVSRWLEKLKASPAKQS